MKRMAPSAGEYWQAAPGKRSAGEEECNGRGLQEKRVHGKRRGKGAQRKRSAGEREHRGTITGEQGEGSGAQFFFSFYNMYYKTWAGNYICYFYCFSILCEK